MSIEESICVRDAVADLCDEQRTAVRLCFWEGLTMAEAALSLGVAKGTVHSRIAEAKKYIKKVLNETPPKVALIYEGRD